MTSPQDPSSAPVLSYISKRPSRTQSLQSAVDRGLQFSSFIYILFAIAVVLIDLLDRWRPKGFPWLVICLSAMFFATAAAFIVCGLKVRRGSRFALLTALALAIFQASATAAALLYLVWLALSAGSWTGGLCALFAIALPATVSVILLSDIIQLLRAQQKADTGAI